MSDDKVKEFWDNQAIEHGASDLATNPDSNYRKLEINSIIKHMKYMKGPRVLDMGCGNGYSTSLFKKAYPKFRFVGYDYSEEMIKQAKINYPDIEFAQKHIIELYRERWLFDIIICCRCLINLEDWSQQRDAIIAMKAALKDNYSFLILVENFIEGLDGLNILREQFGLHAIQQRWHNHYLPEGPFMDLIDKNFNVIEDENIGNLYYIISRVVYAALAQAEGKEPEYSHPINRIAANLPSLGHHNGYSPNMLYVLRKK